MQRETKKTIRCFRLKHRKQSHMSIINSLNAWSDIPIAPPQTNNIIFNY